MRKNYLIAFLTILLYNQFAVGQSINNWRIKADSQSSKTTVKIERKTIPNKYKVFSLDFQSLKTNFRSASKRDHNNKLATTLILDFPLENGITESFLIEKTSVLHPDLEAKYPEIQSFYGVSKKNPLNKIYISMSPAGFTGVITGEKTIYIDPVSKNNVNDYIVYDRTEYDRNPEDAFVCNAVMDETINNAKTASDAKTFTATDGNLRTYRLALACTSAYSAYYGNTIAQVLAAMNTTITRVNSIFRRDLSVVFQIVASNDRLIYINGFNKDASPDSDPYDNYNGSGMLAVNSGNIDGIIGTSAYDIGHVFSTGGGGVASQGPCSTTSGTTAGKGRGVTGIVTPQFDPFDIDYVCHEMGHQFGAAHTYYNACFGQKELVADYEPGSASTIMGYAGICSPNVQENSDAYFHAKSIEQMTTVINGHTCVVGTSSGNSAPVIVALTARTIPKSTPFILTGSATDAQGDPMTYTWEQYDNTDGGVQPPTSTNTSGPVFRSLMPTSDPSRTFPNLAAIISNTTPTWEVLPSVARVMNFRLTARDNSTLGGRTSFANCTVTIGSSAAFSVTSPNLGSEIWYAGETKTVTWNAATTNSATYSTTVNIKLSTDGGSTYPITLVSATANDGSQSLTVPNNVGKLNRIKVEAAANIFFDISNANFEIKSGKFEMTSAASTQSVCKPTSAVYAINYIPAPAFSETTTFSATGAPAGSTITFSPTTTSTSGTFTMTVSNTSGVAAGNYPITIKGTSITANIDFPVLLNVFDIAIGNVTLTSPSNGATNQQTSSLLQWNALTSASSYLVQISTSPTFSTITESATVTGTSYQTTLLTQGTINYWRVKPINSCISGSFSEVSVFQIASDLCKTYTTTTNFSPNSIWETNSNNAVSAKIDIPDNINISKVTFNMKATHASVNDIKMQFSGPTGIFAEVYNRDCATGANFDITFDDAGTALTCGSNPGLGGTQKASQSLSKFNESSSLGTWTLLATDRGINTSGGTFNQFSITICGKLQIVNNITVANNTLTISQGATSTIVQTKLGATQPTATSTQLIYTITQLPLNGTLKLNNVAMTIGGIFTQADINNNLLSYTNNGINSNPDSFKFSINGINLALLGGQIFNINVCGAPIPNINTLTNVMAQCSATASVPVATSNCYGTISGTTPTVFPITAQGTTIITWTYNDGNGNISTQEQTVIVDDTVASLVPVLANITGQCSVTPTAPTTTDVCAGIITGTTTTIFPVTASTVIIWTFNDGNGQSVTANQNIIIGSTTWNGSSWSNSAPINGMNAIVSGNLPVNANFTACSLTVNNNAVMTVNPGVNLNIAGDVTVATGSSLIFENNTNLLQTKNTNGNIGNIIIKRQTSDLKLSDYVLWSSPVSGQQLQSFSPSTLSHRFYIYNPNTNLYNAIAPTSNFALGTGYLIRMPNNHPTSPTIWEGQFQGVPNNGNYNVAVTNSAYNAIGNPYPSTINANAFIATNNITEALYFWRKTNNTATSSYATYTTAGGTANAGGLSSIVPNGIIQVGQGFVAKATASTISFTNLMRIANNANQFLKTKETELHRIWLNLSKDVTPVNQMLIAYMPKATSGIDATIDGRYINDNATALNSLIENEEFVIQGRSLPFSDNDVVPLTFKTNTAGNYTITIDHVDGLFTDSQNIFLSDKLTSANHDLKKTPYSFNATAGTFNDRFEIVFKGNTTLGIDDAAFNENSVLVYNQKGIININAGKETIAAVKIFDIRGRLLYEKKNINSITTALDSFVAAHQTLIIQIISDENKVVRKKLMY